MMKRKWVSKSVENTSDGAYLNQLLQIPTYKTQKYNVQQLNKFQVPPSLKLAPESAKVPVWVGDLLHCIADLNDGNIKLDEQDCPYTNTNNEVKLLLFLGALGKEYINSVTEQLGHYMDSLIFISSSLKLDTCDMVHLSDNQQCSQLSAYFEVIDPLGGGSYPLDYLVVVDSRDYMRCKIPIRICRSSFHSPHAKYGVDLNNLASLIEEHMQHFKATQTLKY